MFRRLLVIQLTLLTLLAGMVLSDYFGPSAVFGIVVLGVVISAAIIIGASIYIWQGRHIPCHYGDNEKPMTREALDGLPRLWENSNSREDKSGG